MFDARRSAATPADRIGDLKSAAGSRQRPPVGDLNGAPPSSLVVADVDCVFAFLCCCVKSALSEKEIVWRSCTVEIVWRDAEKGGWELGDRWAVVRVCGRVGAEKRVDEKIRESCTALTFFN